MGCLRQICIPLLMVKQLLKDIYKGIIMAIIEIFYGCKEPMIMIGGLIVFLTIFSMPSVIWYFAYTKNHCTGIDGEDYHCSMNSAMGYGFATIVALVFVGIPLCIILGSALFIVFVGIYHCLIYFYEKLTECYNHYLESANDEYNQNITYDAVGMDIETQTRF